MESGIQCDKQLDLRIFLDQHLDFIRSQMSSETADACMKYLFTNCPNEIQADMLTEMMQTKERKPKIDVLMRIVREANICGQLIEALDSIGDTDIKARLTTAWDPEETDIETATDSYLNSQVRHLEEKMNKICEEIHSIKHGTNDQMREQFRLMKDKFEEQNKTINSMGRQIERMNNDIVTQNKSLTYLSKQIETMFKEFKAANESSKANQDKSVQQYTSQDEEKLIDPKGMGSSHMKQDKRSKPIKVTLITGTSNKK